MKKTYYYHLTILLIFLFFSSMAVAEPIEVKSYGKFLHMIHMKKTDGVVKLNEAISEKNIYAVGAIQHGLGEITVIDGKLMAMMELVIQSIQYLIMNKRYY